MHLNLIIKAKGRKNGSSDSDYVFDGWDVSMGKESSPKVGGPPKRGMLDKQVSNDLKCVLYIVKYFNIVIVFTRAL